MSHRASSAQRPLLTTLGWAVYLACSWTWCIGMFLPVLMVRQFGFAGWVVFAVPNIVGAAGSGWVLSRPGMAQQVVARHSIACQSFSAVTIAFHCFFVQWAVRGMAGWAGPAIVAGVAVALWLFMRGGKRELIVAAGVFAVSIAMFAVAIGVRGMPSEPAESQGFVHLLWLSPVVVFGFLLCPYLDLTFLRARAMTEPRQGVAAFTIGFGIFFLLMILFTLWYAPLLESEQFGDIRRRLAWILSIHIIFQAAFTIALHARPLTARDAAPAMKVGAIVLGTIAFLLPLTSIGGAGASGIVAAMRGERIYKLFMAFYGLLFPAYVWLCMIPTRDRHAGPSRAKLLVLAIAVLIAAPMFWLGFINDRMIWLVPGLAVILLARLALPGGLLWRARPGPGRAEAALGK